MASREDLLKSMTVAELRKYAVSIKFKNSSSFRKSDLIKALLEYEKELTRDSEKANKQEKKEVECSEDSTGNKASACDIDTAQKMKYVESAKIGTLVAFRLPSGKVKSAKIIKRSTSARKLMVATDYGMQYIISYDDVVWVRSGLKWPKGVYMLLKGLVNDGAAGY